MNKPKLIMLIIQGINFLFGLVWMLSDLGSERFKKHLPLFMLFGTFIGALICLFILIRKFIGVSIFSLLVFIVVGAALVSATGLGSMAAGVICIILDVIYAIMNFSKLRILIPPTDTDEQS